MSHADLLIYNAAQVVTCASPSGPKRGADLADPGLIQQGALAIADGRIVAVGPSEEVRAGYAAHEEIDAGGRVLCPGFVDCHTHLVFAGDRVAEWEQKIAGVPYLEILASGGGILSTMRATRAAPFQHLLAEARSRLDAMLALGTTSVEIKTGYGLDHDSELTLLRVIGALARSHPCDIAPTLLAAHAVPPEFGGNADAYVQFVEAHILPAAAGWYADSPFPAAGVPMGCDVFCEAHAFDLAQSRRVLQAGVAHHMRAKIHADQFHSLGGVTLAVEMDALSADHMDVTPPADHAVLGAASTLAVLLPAVNFHLGSTTFANARGLIDAGAAVALATDLNPGSAPCLSLPLVMAIACRYLRLTPAEALNACTINAAHALGLGRRIGSLEVGMQADVLMLEMPDYRQLAYWLGGNPVAQVIKRGRMVG